MDNEIYTLESTNVESWTVEQVIKWFEAKGFTDISHNLLEHEIDGQVLVGLDNSGLLEIGVKRLGIRMSILKEIYHLKRKFNIQETIDTYIPLLEQVQSNLEMSKLRDRVARQEKTIDMLIEKVNTLQRKIEDLERGNSPNCNSANSTGSLTSPTLRKRRDEELRKVGGIGDTSVGTEQRNKKNLNVGGDTDVSPTSSRYFTSVRTFENRVGNANNIFEKSHERVTQEQENEGEGGKDKANANANANAKAKARDVETEEARQHKEKPKPTLEISDANPFKSVRIGLEDPCYKVLPHALKKYNIKGDWRDYELVIVTNGLSPSSPTAAIPTSTTPTTMMPVNSTTITSGTPASLLEHALAAPHGDKDKLRLLIPGESSKHDNSSGSKQRKQREIVLKSQDKPLLIFQQLLDLGENPMLVLKHNNGGNNNNISRGAGGDDIGFGTRPKKKT